MASTCISSSSCMDKNSSYSSTPTVSIEETTDRVRLKRQLGLFNGIGIIAGLVIGGGIYMSPRGVLLHAGSPGLSLVFWGIGGVLTLLGAFTYAEIGVAMPESGALYAYLRRLYGPLAAFLYCWSYLFFVRGGANAIKCLMFGRYVLKPFFPDCPVPDIAVKLIGTVVACSLTVVNCVSVKISARGQTAMTVVSILTLLLIGVVGIVWLLTESSELNLSVAFDGSTTEIGEWSLALHTTIYSYYGWSALNFLVEELKNPARNLPLSLAISVSMATVLYVLANLSFLAVLGTDGVLQSEAVATSVAVKALGPMAWIMPLLISITACSSFNSGMMVGSRLSFAGSRRGHLPAVLALINIKYLTPITSLISQCIVSVCFIWSIEVYSLITNTMFLNLFFDGLVVIGFIRLRWREKAVPRPKDRSINLPIIVPILYSLIITLLVAVPLITKPHESATGLFMMLATGLPYYAVFIAWKNKPQIVVRYGAFVTRFVQKLLYCLPQEVKLED